MKPLATGSAVKDLYNGGSGEVAIALDGANLSYVNAEPFGVLLYVRIKLDGVTEGATISVQVTAGPSPAGKRYLKQPDMSYTFVADDTIVPIHVELSLSPDAGIADVMGIVLGSGNASDTVVTVDTEICRIDGQDENGRVDVGKIAGDEVSTTAGDLNTNARLIGGNTPLTREEVMNSRGGW